MRIAHINVSASDSSGRTAAYLCRTVQQLGHKSLLCYWRGHPPADVNSYRIGGKPSALKRSAVPPRGIARFFSNLSDRLWHGLAPELHIFHTRLLDRAGFFGKRVTRRLVRQLAFFKPDIVHLHTLHGYYLHLPTLFHYLKTNDIPVVWSMQDCWAFTGHCVCYSTAKNAPNMNVKRSRLKTETVGCDRWQHGCGKCVQKRCYPSSWLVDNSASNWTRKRELLTGHAHMVLTVPSNWMRDELTRSFLHYPVYVLPAGVDTSVFQPCLSGTYMNEAAKSYGLDLRGDRPIILSAAPAWDDRHGLEDLNALAHQLGDGYSVVVSGATDVQLEKLTDNKLLPIRYPGNLNDLCALYTAAKVYVCAARDAASATSLSEAMACGTPVVCYASEGIAESITLDAGEAVPAGNIDALVQAVKKLCELSEEEHSKLSQACLAHAASCSMDERSTAYMRLYEKMYRFSPAYETAYAKKAGKHRRKPE